MSKLYTVMIALLLTACGDMTDSRSPAQQRVDRQRSERAAEARTQQRLWEVEARRQNERRKQDWLRSH